MSIKSLARALVDRILNGEGRASPEQRARAFSNADVPLAALAEATVNGEAAHGVRRGLRQLPLAHDQ